MARVGLACLGDMPLARLAGGTCPCPGDPSGTCPLFDPTGAGHAPSVAAQRSMLLLREPPQGTCPPLDAGGGHDAHMSIAGREDWACPVGTWSRGRACPSEAMSHGVLI